MSRIGKRLIVVPKEAKITVNGNKVLVEGPKGKLEQTVADGLKIEVKDSSLAVKGSAETKLDRIVWGTARALIANMIKGVCAGYTKELEIVGVGFRAQLQGTTLNMQLGFSHPVVYNPPEGIKIETPKPTQIVIKGCSKEKVGQVAAELRAIFPPEPYKGKGIRYSAEQVRKKLGKAVSKAGAA